MDRDHATPTEPTPRWKVSLQRVGTRLKGHVQVAALSEAAAEKKAVEQTIEVSYPNTLPRHWRVLQTEKLAS